MYLFQLQFKKIVMLLAVFLIRMQCNSETSYLTALEGFFIATERMLVS